MKLTHGAPAAAARIARLPLDAHSYPELMRHLNEVIVDVIGPSKTGVLVFDVKSGMATLMQGSFGAAHPSGSVNFRTFKPMASRPVFETGEPYVTDDAQTDPGVVGAREFMRSRGVRPALFLRLEAHGTRIGVLIVGRSDGRFTQADIDVLAPLLPEITTALHTSATLLEMKRGQRLEAVLGDVAVAIASARSLREFLPRGLDELCDATHAALAVLLMRGAAPIVSPSSAVEDTALKTLLAKIRLEAKVREELQAWRSPEMARISGLYLPVRFGSQLVGTLALFRTDGEVFAAEDRNILIRLANVTGLAWAAERYQQQRAELARRDERARIADELHDDLAQMLFAAQMNLDSILLAEMPLDPAVRDGILRGRDLLARVDETVRHLIHQLARPAQHDLCSRLRQIADAVESEFGLPVRLELSDDAASAATALRTAERDVLAKVARELLINAAKHAGPCRATVKLQLGTRDRLLLTVIDDGIGLDRAAAGHGLLAIRGALRAQGGTLRVSAGLGGGVHATAAIGVTGRGGRKPAALAASD